MKKIILWDEKVIYTPENVIKTIHCGYENVLLVHNVSISPEVLNEKLQEFIENEDEDYNDIDKFFESIGLDATYSYSDEYEEVRDQLAFFDAKQAGGQSHNNFFFNIADTDKFPKTIIYQYWNQEIGDWDELELNEENDKIELEVTENSFFLRKMEYLDEYDVKRTRNEYIYKILSINKEKAENKYLVVYSPLDNPLDNPLDYGEILESIQEVKEYIISYLKYDKDEVEEMIKVIEILR